MFCKKAALKTQEDACVESLFNQISRFQACKFIKKRLRDRCLFSCESREIFKNTYFGEHLRTAAFCIVNTKLRQTTLQNPSPNIAKQQEEEIQFERESFKFKLTLH